MLLLFCLERSRERRTKEMAWNQNDNPESLISGLFFILSPFCPTSSSRWYSGNGNSHWYWGKTGDPGAHGIQPALRETGTAFVVSLRSLMQHFRPPWCRAGLIMDTVQDSQSF